MSSIEPLTRIRYAEKEIERYREDSLASTNGHAANTGSTSLWNDIVAKANFLFQRILDVDLQIHEALLADKAADDSSASTALAKVLRDWLEISQKVARTLEHHSVDDAESFRANLAQAQWMLTSDAELFAGEKWIELRDHAVDSHHEGQTGSLVPE